MKFHVLTLFPEIPRAFFESSIMAKAVDRGIIAYDLVNIRDFAFDKHKTCDDSPYGGGAGMLMLPEPLGLALESVKARRKRVIYVTPSGKPFTQKLAQELSREEELVFICGRYEGIDQRIIDSWVDDEISIGDYVLSSGEIAATVIIDAVYRLVDGVISSESLDEESYSGGLLEYPQYTRPEVYGGMSVPEVLLSGHHENIRKWRLEKRLAKTLANRPDMVCEARRDGLLTAEAEQMIETITGQVRKSVRKKKRPKTDKFSGRSD
ncbi:tRNA (guanosine(37)-N1)-methyltransferase TrmD [Treponema brennaborense]|uniref:tRNA (guanine-N(1)-)-methyltransferase n=1 Tax=Treponema brennaborense (strain DSM 12168 / CIP 105900 / DD5/3) TaxID=906968 RepID=F4LJ84_TREBD|nr:tRNA (guanosine(37)-N1)-methyltransferase TrmD [Treponema brennaborense]AEE16341.1 tRNA (guanine-N(1)-)-methyltransferase [Treponema brennaborense DSM 12168]